MSISMKKPVWQAAEKQETNVAKFIAYVNEKRNVQLNTYHELHRWSVAASTMSDFWADVYTFLQLAPLHHSGVGRVLDHEITDTTPLYPPPRFFPTETLNVAEHILRSGHDDTIAVHFIREGISGVERVSWRTLRERTRAMRDAMLSHGVGKGDVIAAVISNSLDAMVICLAALSIGAVWSSASCELGVEPIIERFSQVHPKLIFADDGYIYGGKLVNLEERIREWSHHLGKSGDSLGGVVVVPYCKLAIDTGEISKGISLGAFLSKGEGRALDFEYVSFSHPAFILYSSGTTGAPKCIVHSAGGVLLKVKTDSILQHDVRDSDVVFQYTTTAWVMWVLNFINLSCGRSMMLYDGSPFHPHPGVLLELAAKLGVGVFGTSPRYLAEIRARGIVPKKSYDLRRLRIVTSTGAVLSSELYSWFYDTAFPPAVQLISMSGGTDIAGSFVGGTPLLPVYSGEIQVKALGMAIEIFDAAETDGISVESTGSAGELVCTKPFPSQPIQFFGADGAKRYWASYFERFGNTVWCQGDFIQVEKDTDGLIMLGRSDGVLNPSGVRFGSAEIYAVTETFPEIDDSICVGQRRKRDTDESVLLFVKMKAGYSLATNFANKLKTAIRQKYSPRHVPKYIFQIADIPYTVNGKKCEINVKQIVSGLSTTVSGTVSNPDSLNLYKEYLHLPIDGKGSQLNLSKL